MSKTRPWLATMSAASLAFLYAPIAVLVIFSFNASRLSASWQGFTLHWYETLARDAALWTSVKNSLVAAAGSTTVATLLGVAAAIGLERMSKRSQRFADGFLLLPLVIPEVMMGVALMLLFVFIKWPLSLMTVTIGHAAFNLPIVMVIVRARLRKLDPALEDAARDLGATQWQVLRRVTLPLILPAVVGADTLTSTVKV